MFGKTGRKPVQKPTPNTKGEQMKFTLNKAAKEAGVAKSTLSEAIKSGRISAPKNEKGQYEIEASELFREFPKTSLNEHPEPTPNTLSNTEKTSESNVLQAKLDAVREQLEMVNLERERERQQLSDQIEHLRGALDKAQQTTAMLTDQREGQGGRLTWSERFSGRKKA